MGLLRAWMRLGQLGSGDLFSHSLSISFKQSLGGLYGPFKAWRKPGDNPSTRPRFSQSEQMSTSSVSTTTKSLGPSAPTAGIEVDSQNEYKNALMHVQVYI